MVHALLCAISLFIVAFVKLPGESQSVWAFNDRATDVDEQSSFASGSIDISSDQDHNSATSDQAAFIKISDSVNNDNPLPEEVSNEADVPTSENQEANADNAGERGNAVENSNAASTKAPSIVVTKPTGQPQKLPAEVAEFLGDTPVKPLKKYTIAQVNVLDMLSARTTRVDIPVGKARTFDTLIIAVSACQDTLELGGYQAFLNITEQRIGRVEQPVFNGWMFSDSLSLSSMENPTFDVTLAGCK